MTSKSTIIIFCILAVFIEPAYAIHESQQCRLEPEISCVDLAIALTAIDQQLESENIDFDNLGELLQELKNNVTLFNQITTAFSQLIGTKFTTIDEIYEAGITCGLIPHQIDLINDDEIL